MLLQTNSYIVPKERRAEHARMIRRFRQALAKIGCDQFEVYEQVGANWSPAGANGRYVQIMRFRDRQHQQAVQAAERSDPGAQQIIAEFCDLINFPYQQQNGYFATGFYTSVLPVGPRQAAAELASDLRYAETGQEEGAHAAEGEEFYEAEDAPPAEEPEASAELQESLPAEETEPLAEELEAPAEGEPLPESALAEQPAAPEETESYADVNAIPSEELEPALTEEEIVPAEKLEPALTEEEIAPAEEMPPAAEEMHETVAEASIPAEQEMTEAPPLEEEAAYEQELPAVPEPLEAESDLPALEELPAEVDHAKPPEAEAELGDMGLIFEDEPAEAESSAEHSRELNTLHAELTPPEPTHSPDPIALGAPLPDDAELEELEELPPDELQLQTATVRFGDAAAQEANAGHGVSPAGSTHGSEEKDAEMLAFEAFLRGLDESDAESSQPKH